jgi:Zn-dependent protease
MKLREFLHVLAAIIIFTAIGSFSFLLTSQWFMLPRVLLFATIIIFVSIFAKKIMASLLDTDVEHEIWNVSRYGIKKHQRLNKEIPGGIIFPLIISLFSLGWIKFAAFLTYEARALKRRAAKRFGFYSFAEITEWHNGLIGAAGIISLFVLAIIAYFLPYGLSYLSKLAIYYAISNLIPISKLDGTQIFFGSKTLWTALALIALIFGAFAFGIVQ